MNVSWDKIRKRLKQTALIGETARNHMGRILRNAYYGESEVRQACADIFNSSGALDFNDPNIIRSDLLALASQLGHDKAPLDLNTSNISSLSITCQNGRTVKGPTYLHTAARALGFAKNVKEAASKQAQILKYLLKTAGFDVPEYEPLDHAYFQNPRNLQADLSSFASQLGHDGVPLDLNTSNISSLSITCQNGQVMKGQAYLSTATRALGFAKNAREARPKQAFILCKLKKMAGFLTPTHD